MPVGNGDIGLNVWVENGGDLLFYVAKNDSWCENARLLTLGRFRVKLNPNPFGEGLPFQQELSLRQGKIAITAGQEDSQISIRLWVDANEPVAQIEVDGTKDFDIKVSLETWRNEEHELMNLTHSDIYYNYLEPPSPFKMIVKPDVVIPGDKDRITWYHDNGESDAFYNNMKLQGMEGFMDRLEDPLSGRIFGGTLIGSGLEKEDDKTLKSMKSGKQHSLSLYVLTKHPSTPEQWQNELAGIIDRVEKTGIDEARVAHEKWWSDFWDRSWIYLSGAEETESVTNGYLLFRYMLACAGRGAQPIKFNGSIFTWDHGDGPDFRDWGPAFWYQNQRLFYWPLMATGDFNLMQAHFMMYRNALDLAKYRTQKYFGHGGAHFPETMYFWGTYAGCDFGWNNPRTVVDNKYVRYYWQNALEQTAMMIDYYLYTQDNDFATGVLFPMADAIIEFYDEHYQRDSEGKIRFEPAHSLETWWESINPMPEIAGLTFNLRNLLTLPEKLTTEQQRSNWQRLLSELPQVPTREVDGEWILAAADTFADKHNIENPELYAVFPYCLYGAGKPDIDRAIGAFQQRLHIEGNYGHDQDDIHAAYLGLASTVREMLTRRMGPEYLAGRFPAYWHGGYDWPPDYCHGGAGMIALQAALMQCEGQKIMLFPAWLEEWDVNFKLHAPYETTVLGIYRNGKLESLEVYPESRRKDIVIMGSDESYVMND
jgi:hypothetical protein